ncbi:hypothetical protein VIGAN_04182500 [Vigna angularis var. angularis]|uniref:Uncharacterized protein n=1 Tax=Vigna angularis var. angularis TaxID=157739 RepID=A0A0S3RVH2_PHAAN|nr:hypothetical protein VIGAN_04182500 [Vigna angularis var. angularis]
MVTPQKVFSFLVYVETEENFEEHMAARGIMALEACNCIASSFMLNSELSPVCLTLIETAKSCLSAKDKYLQSTIQLLNKQCPTL